MTQDLLKQRLEILKTEEQSVKYRIFLLNESLEQTRCQLHTINGNINELNYIINTQNDSHTVESTEKKDGQTEY